MLTMTPAHRREILADWYAQIGVHHAAAPVLRMTGRDSKAWRGSNVVNHIADNISADGETVFLAPGFKHLVH